MSTITITKTITLPGSSAVRIARILELLSVELAAKAKESQRFHLLRQADMRERDSAEARRLADLIREKLA